MVKKLPANARDMGDMSSTLVSEDPLEKEMAAFPSILAWEIPCTEDPRRAAVHAIAKSRT